MVEEVSEIFECASAVSVLGAEKLYQNLSQIVFFSVTAIDF
jgi:hypothetical protein